MSYSTYITTWNSNPIVQVQDMINNSVIKTNTRIILAFASFNFVSNDYIPGIFNMNLDDLKNFTDLVHNSGGKVSLSIGGATYPFYESDLYDKPGDLANNINELLIKCGFDGVDFDIEDSSNVVPNDFAINAASLINTLRNINKTLNITLTTPAQAWLSINYQKKLLDLTFGNIDAWQPMEYDLWINTGSNYFEQIEYDINYYIDNWSVNPNKIILGLMPGKDDNNINLSLEDALNLTTFAKTKKLQGVMTWSANIDSTGCDGNAKYAYSLGIQTTLKNFTNILKKIICCYK
jgi:chitinase